ncbi:MAG TPA: DinB family protein [Candidatus Nitrosotalea sp.]|nr:DinB family protein [Candidatus Nitrosotalea sp.]
MSALRLDVVRRELARGAETIAALAAGVADDEARRRPAPEAWSLLEVICHLHDEEREDFRPRLDLVLHRPQDTWTRIDPAGWITARRYNERDLAEALQGFLVERERSLAWLGSLAAPDWSREYQAPFGRITAGDLLASWAAHDLLHTRQLVELRRARLLAQAAPYSTQYAGDW